MTDWMNVDYRKRSEENTYTTRIAGEKKYTVKGSSLELPLYAPSLTLAAPDADAHIAQALTTHQPLSTRAHQHLLQPYRSLPPFFLSLTTEPLYPAKENPRSLYINTALQRLFINLLRTFVLGLQKKRKQPLVSLFYIKHTTYKTKLNITLFKH